MVKAVLYKGGESSLMTGQRRRYRAVPREAAFPTCFFEGPTNSWNNYLTTPVYCCRTVGSFPRSE